MDAALAIAIGLAFAFALTNGLHDASNAIAALVATRAARRELYRRFSRSPTS
jgi:phosphate/sulfate permease